MNAVTPQSDYGYSYGARALRSDRDTEYDVFSRVTRMMRQAGPMGGADEILAVHKNTELWTILAADLAETGNALPDEVKAGLLSLANFSIRHGRAVMSGKATIQPLIDINLSVMKGLRGEVGA
ncbi:flagellar biosynthesis regulator FlaF [Paracoccus sp. (in: a-proteobacteria)]|uniref:flagellar biosynthesis regulator FlaF n=1 Tax=Paracoccus sp. TaxID=267 RepID=UPI003A8AB5ED